MSVSILSSRSENMCCLFTACASSVHSSYMRYAQRIYTVVHSECMSCAQNLHKLHSGDPFYIWSCTMCSERRENWNEILIRSVHVELFLGALLDVRNHALLYTHILYQSNMKRCSWKLDVGTVCQIQFYMKIHARSLSALRIVRRLLFAMSLPRFCPSHKLPFKV